jgi:aspartate racemase
VRIEPGEVEVVLNEHPSVRQSAVLAREIGSGQKRLAAYITLRSKATPTVRELRNFLAKRLPGPMIPSSFVMLDELPLNASGKIDRRSLLASQEGNMLSVGSGTAPRDELEKRLQRIWEDLLEIENIGVQQDFFELGGDSLLAVRLLVDVEKALSFKLPLSALLEARTIEDLARAIRRHSAESDWSSLVAVQPLGSRPPLFCIHSHTGDVMYCEYIARGAGPDQPIYGLQSRGLTGKPPHLTVEEMSDYYLRELRRIQPKGPYHLFGFCFGGMVAFDITRRLNDEGEVVSYLGLYNAPAPGTLKGWPLGQLSYIVKRTRYELSRLHNMGTRKQVDHLLRNIRNFGLMLVRTAHVEIWRAGSRLRGSRNVHDLREKVVNLEELNIAAAKNFAPAYVYPGRITLYLGPEVVDVYPVAPEVGWAAYAAAGVDAIGVPLDEDAWRGAPFVETVGGSLKQYISLPRTFSAAGGNVSA